jgi:hypothetical protein
MIDELMNRACTLVLNDSTGVIDDDGEEVINVTAVETTCELQQQQRDEQDDQGELGETTWRLFLPATPVTQQLRSADRAVIDGQVFEFIGDPWAARNPRTVAVSHVEATVRRIAGSDTGS